MDDVVVMVRVRVGYSSGNKYPEKSDAVIMKFSLRQIYGF